MTRDVAVGETYTVFGLGLSVSRPIPRLKAVAGSVNADVRIELGETPTWAGDMGRARVRYESPVLDTRGQPTVVVTERDRGGLHVAYPDDTNFWIDEGGTRVWVTWNNTLTLDDMSSYLLGPIMGLVLRLRGTVCLHASAIAAGGLAFAIVGRSGAGKSTTAAALGERGYAVLADDVVALEEVAGVFRAAPAYPRLRLSPTSAAFLTPRGVPNAEDPSTFDQSRYHLDVTANGYAFQAEALPLAAVYVLETRSDGHEALRLQPVSGAESLMTLVAHSFAKALLDPDMRAKELDVFGRLAATLRVVRVTPHERLERLPELCDLLLDDFASVSTRAR